MLELLFFILSLKVSYMHDNHDSRPIQLSVSIQPGTSSETETIDNAVLKRLIMEVKVENSENRIHAYNRTHNRHNRGR